MTMAKLSAPKKPTAKAAPKKPTSRSKTGNAACSEAASNWQLSLRGKAALSPETYKTLAKCRSLNRAGKLAEAQGRTGKLSEMGEAAVKGRLQARFDSGLITQKARTEKLNLLLKQRSERGNAVVAKSATTEAVKPTSSFTAISPEEQAIRDRFRQIAKQNPQSPAVTGESRLDAWRRKNAAYERRNAAVQVSYATESHPGEMIPPRPKPVEAKPGYSLGGKLAPGRGTFLRSVKARELKHGKDIAAKSSGLTLFPVGPNKTQRVVAKARALADVSKGSGLNRLQTTNTAFGRNTKDRQQLAYQIANTRRSVKATEDRLAEIQKMNSRRQWPDNLSQSRAEERLDGYKYDLAQLKKQGKKLTSRSNVLVQKLARR